MSFENKIVISNNELIIIQTDENFFCFPTKQLNHALSYLNNDFDIGMRRWIKLNCKSDSTFIDIGANVGTFSAVASKLITGNGTVIAIEPISSLENCIRQNVMLNNSAVNFEYIPVALSNKSGDIELQLFDLDNRVSTLWKYGENKKNVSTIKNVKVKTGKLDKEIKSLNEDTVIKVDVEGSEMEILQQINLLSERFSNSNFTIAFEYSPSHFKRANTSSTEIINFIMENFRCSCYFIDEFDGTNKEKLSEHNINKSGNVSFSFCKNKI